MILHVDMDAFYASVEERDRPELAGRPVIVGGSPRGRGVVAAANYVARGVGVHSAMPTARALRLCPHAELIAPRIGYYASISRQIREIFDHYTPLVEPLALDEAFLDVAGSESLFGSAVEIGQTIKRTIRDRLCLVASVGVAPNKFLAKIASDVDKPDGFVVVEPADVQTFLDPLPVGRLMGVGRVTGERFERLGAKTMRDVRQLPIDVLREQLGRYGEQVWQLVRGIDGRPVVTDREAKSISHETTFAEDIADPQVLRAWLVELSEQVAWRLRTDGLKGRTVHLKVRWSDFHTITRDRTLPQPTDSTQEICQVAAAMLDACLPAKGRAVRLLGVGVRGLQAAGAPTQRLLFDDPQQSAQKELDRAADQIRQRFGSDALGRASRLLRDE